MEIIKNESIIGNSTIHATHVHESIYQFLHSLGLIFSGPFVETALRPIRFAGRELSKDKTEWIYCKYLEKGILITVGSFHPSFPQKITRFFPYSSQWKSLQPDERHSLEQLKKSQQERAKHSLELEKIRAAKARETAFSIYTKASTEGVIHHPYFIRKQLNHPYDLRVTDYPILNRAISSLVVPIRDFSNAIQGIQLIFSDKIDFGNGKPRDKHIIGTLKGNFFLMGDFGNKGRYIICEGVATGFALFQSSFYTTLSCLSCTNYYPVVEGLIRRYPRTTILIACDNDSATTGNPGIKEAKRIQRAFSNIKLIVPPAQNRHSVDFNDLYCRGIA